MTPERWTRIKEIFNAVIDQPATARDTALDQLCARDPELRQEVEHLLSHHGKAGPFMDAAPPLPAAHAAKERFSPGSLLAGRYQITKFLGSGGMGEVYAANDLELSGQVALKVIREQGPEVPAVLDRLRREVQLARRVTHPNVCRVFDLGRHTQAGQDLIFLTMELIEGETLTDRLRQEQKIRGPEALAIAVQLCHALEAAHHAGVLHRDFKCGNVMLAGSGSQVRAVVTDFGIARGMQPQTDPQSTVSQTMIAGTPAYMSPEQLAGQPLTAASDIYSLGLVLYEMVTGARPFRADSPLTEAFRRLNEPPEPPIKAAPEIGETWNQTILKCLEREPGRRFAAAQEIADVLLGAKPAVPPALPWRRHRWLWAVASLLVVLAASAFVFRDRIWPARLPSQKHVAVLPFTSTGTDPTDRATAYGLAESLTANLARLQPTENSLWVVPWSQTRNRTSASPGNAAAALGTNLIVTGNMEKVGDKLLFQANLKDAVTLKNLRSRTIEVAQAQRVTLEDTLLEQVAAMLQLNVPDGTLHHLAGAETNVPGAYEFYEQGRGYLLNIQPHMANLDPAIALFQKAADQDPNFALAYANLAYAYALKFKSTQDRQWREKAIELCGKASALNNKLAPVHLALGTIARASGDPDTEVRELEKALQLDPTSDETLNLLSIAYDDSGRPLQAESLLKEAVRRSPGSWVNYTYLGYFYYRHAQYAQAEPLFRTAGDLAPDNPAPFVNLGGVYLALGKYKEAEDILTRAVSIKPNPSAYSNLGVSRFYLGRYKDAAAAFQKAIDLNPGDDRYWRNLGDAYSLAGQPEKAVPAYERAIQEVEKILVNRPRDSQMLQRLALYDAKLGRKDKALSAMAQAAQVSARDPEFIFNSALVYELTGQRDRALSALSSAIRAGYSVQQVQDVHELDQLRSDKRYARMVRGEG